MNNEDIQKYYQIFGRQKIEIVLDGDGILTQGPQTIAASPMIAYYLLDYFKANPSGLEAQAMIGGLTQVLAGFKLEVK